MYETMRIYGGVLYRRIMLLVVVVVQAKASASMGDYNGGLQMSVFDLSSV